MPSGVSNYNGGYIKTEFLSKGDSKVTGGNAKSEDEEDTEEEEQEEETTEEEENTQEPTTPPTEPTVPEEPSDPTQDLQQQCINSGGTWQNGACIYQNTGNNGNTGMETFRLDSLTLPDSRKRIL